MHKTDTPLTITLDRFEGHHAILTFPGQQSVSVSRRFVPKSAKEGDILTIELLSDEQKSRRQQHLARAVLEEILRGE